MNNKDHLVGQLTGLYQEVKRQLFGFGIIGSARNFFRIIVHVSATCNICVKSHGFGVHLAH